MSIRIVLASVTGALLLASPMAAFATSTKAPATTSTAPKDACKNLKGNALKDCKAKAAAAKKDTKAK